MRASVFGLPMAHPGGFSGLIAAIAERPFTADGGR
jgi:hypothetical protein